MATSSRANPSRPIDPPLSKLECFIGIAVVVAGLVVFFGIVIGLPLLLESKNNDPSFQLNFVSVNAANSTSARWDIAFSLDKTVGDLSVWVRFMGGRDYRANSVGIAGNRTVSVTTNLPPPGFDFSDGRLTIEQVLFRSNNYNNYVLEAACKNVTLVVVANSTTQLVINGGPRLCPQLPYN